MAGIIPVSGDYANYFFVIIFAPALIATGAAMVAFMIWAIICAVKRRQLSSELPDVDDFSPKDDYTTLMERAKWDVFHPTVFRVFFYVVIGDIVWVMVVFCIFDFWPIEAALPVAIVTAWVAWILLLPFQTEEKISSFRKSRSDWLKGHSKHVVLKARGRPILFFGGLIVLLVFLIIACILGEGICVPDVPLALSTRWTRARQAQACTSGITPCHVYLTYAEDPSTSVIVNFHSPIFSIGENGVPIVHYDTVPRTKLEDYQFNATGKVFYYDTKDMRRAIQWVFLQGLTPDTTYFFRAGSSLDPNTFSPEKKFRTLLGEGATSFISGGDVGLSAEADQVSIQAAKTKPEFGVVGGDISYADGMYTCYPIWDAWLSSWENILVHDDGTMVPMILALGNHEAGGFHQPLSNIPYYFTFFPQSQADVEASNIAQRKSYHAHKISSKAVLFALDSVVTSDFSGNEQTAWLEDQMKNVYANVPMKSAVYHVPLYPSFRPFDNSESVEVRDLWMGLFDKYNLTIGFENHDHSYKRTKLMKNGVVDPAGTLYVGDGAWGAPPRVRGDLPLADYIEKYEERNFVFHVTVTNNRLVNFTSIGIDGSVFDQFTKAF